MYVKFDNLEFASFCWIGWWCYVWTWIVWLFMLFLLLVSVVFWFDFFGFILLCRVYLYGIFEVCWVFDCCYSFVWALGWLFVAWRLFVLVVCGWWFDCLVYLVFEWTLCWVCGCLVEFCLLMMYSFIVCCYLVLIVLGSSLFYVVEFVVEYLSWLCFFYCFCLGWFVCFDFGLIEVFCCLNWFVVLMLVVCYIALGDCCWLRWSGVLCILCYWFWCVFVWWFVIVGGFVGLLWGWWFCSVGYCLDWLFGLGDLCW